MLPIFIFGVFVSSIVATACGLLAWGIHTDHRSRQMEKKDTQIGNALDSDR